METDASDEFSQIHSACVLSLANDCAVPPIESSRVYFLRIRLWGENVKTDVFQCFSSFIELRVWSLWWSYRITEGTCKASNFRLKRTVVPFVLICTFIFEL